MIYLLLALQLIVGSGEIEGRITDENGDALPYTTIVLSQDKAIVKGAVADIEGNYLIGEIDPGCYDLEFSYVGYRTQRIRNVLVPNGKIRIDAILPEGVLMHVVDVTEYKVPLIVANCGGTGDALTAEDIKNLPVKDIGDLVKAKKGVATSGSDVQIKGSRPDATVYYLNGVRVSGTSQTRTKVSSSDPISKKKEIKKLPSSTHIISAEVTRSAATSGSEIFIKGSRDNATVYYLDSGRHPGTIPPQTEIAKTDLESELLISINTSESAGGMDYPEWEDPESHAGILTSGEINDFSKWEMWQDISQEDFYQYKSIWGLEPAERYTVQLKDDKGNPVIDQVVRLETESGVLLWEGRTDNQGRGELWNNLFGVNAIKPKKLKISTSVNGEVFTIRRPKRISEGINVLEVSPVCVEELKLDIAFVVDATASMMDEIDYLKSDLAAVINGVKSNTEIGDINLGAVFYRDHTDDYLTRQLDFTESIDKIHGFIGNQSGRGGGDKPEAVDEGLQVALHDLKWKSDAHVKILFLLLDAGPHQHAEVVDRLHRQIALAASMGVQIIPIAASGIEKSDEYLLRSIALATNGTYLFLTDDSGVGDDHIDPTTDSYDVELLHDALVRVITQRAGVKTCGDQEEWLAHNLDSLNMLETNLNKFRDQELNPQKGHSESLTWNYYPNPTRDVVEVKCSVPGGNLSVSDLTGKLLLQKSLRKKQNETKLNLDMLPSATYILHYKTKEGYVLTGQIVLI